MGLYLGGGGGGGRLLSEGHLHLRFRGLFSGGLIGGGGSLLLEFYGILLKIYRTFTSTLFYLIIYFHALINSKVTSHQKHLLTN